MERPYSNIKMWCEECQDKTWHYPLLNSDEYIARWVCVDNDKHEFYKASEYTVESGEKIDNE